MEKLKPINQVFEKNVDWRKINNQIRELEKKKQKQKNPEHIHTNGLKSLIIYVCWTEAKQLYCFHCMFLYG